MKKLMPIFLFAALGANLSIAKTAEEATRDQFKKEISKNPCLTDPNMKTCKVRTKDKQTATVKKGEYNQGVYISDTSGKNVSLQLNKKNNSVTVKSSSDPNLTGKTFQKTP